MKQQTRFADGRDFARNLREIFRGFAQMDVIKKKKKTFYFKKSSHRFKASIIESSRNPLRVQILNVESFIEKSSSKVRGFAKLQDFKKKKKSLLRRKVFKNKPRKKIRAIF